MRTGLIFDIDGTLWDATDTIAIAYSRAVASETDLEYRVTGDILRAQFGRRMPEVAERVFWMLTAEESHTLLDKCLELQPGVLREFRPKPYPGTEDVIRKLAGEYPLYIVSNCQGGYPECFMEITGLEDCFSRHLCPDDTGVGKAENIRILMEREKLDRGIYIGDLILDRIASEEAGAGFIYASYGFGDIPDAEFRIDTISELPETVRRMLAK